MPLLSCAIYVSSGVSTIAARVARAAAATPCVAIVDTFTDEAYARSSVKLVAEPETLLAAATAVATQAFELVDLSQQPHPAPHPRQGSVDMVSFMPLSEESVETISSELDLCDGLAWRLGHSLGTLGCPVLMYGPRSGRSLLETRRGTSFFESCKAETPREATTSLPIDFGGMADGVPQKCGVAIVGVQPCMHSGAPRPWAALRHSMRSHPVSLAPRASPSADVTNFNIQVEAASLADCKRAATALRSQMGVQVMALPHESGTCEIGCNLQASQTRPSQPRDAVLSLVESTLPTTARVRRSYVVGLTPGEAAAEAERMLQVAASEGLKGVQGA